MKKSIILAILISTLSFAGHSEEENELSVGVIDFRGLLTDIYKGMGFDLVVNRSISHTNYSKYKEEYLNELLYIVDMLCDIDKENNSCIEHNRKKNYETNHSIQSTSDLDFYEKLTNLLKGSEKLSSSGAITENINHEYIMVLITIEANLLPYVCKKNPSITQCIGYFKEQERRKEEE